MNKKIIPLLSMLLCLHSSIESKSAPTPTPAPVEEECDWYCQLSAPVKQTPLTPSEIATQVAQLSSADLSTLLQNISNQLTVAKPTGNSKTSSFLTGLYSALDGLTTLLTQITKSTDLSSISSLKQYLQSRLLQIAGSF